MKNAILAVSFGTAYPDALESAISPTEQALAAACPGWTLRRAFTSDTIRQRLMRSGLAVDSVPQAMRSGGGLTWVCASIQVRINGSGQ